MFRIIIFVSLFGLALVLSGCVSSRSGGGSDSRNIMREYYINIDTGQIISKHEDPIKNALQECREKAEFLFRNQVRNIQKIQEKTDSCLKKMGYEPLR